MVGSNLLSALKKKAKRYSFSDRSPTRFYKPKRSLSASPSPSTSPGKSPNEQGVSRSHSLTTTPALSAVSTPKQLAIQPHVDAASIDKPVPQLERRQPLQIVPPQTPKVLCSTPEDSVLLITDSPHCFGGETTERKTNESDASVSSSVADSSRESTQSERLLQEDSAGSPQVVSETFPIISQSLPPLPLLSGFLFASFLTLLPLLLLQAFVVDPDVIGWSESTSKMAGDAEALLEMELAALTNRYEVLKQKAEAREKMFGSQGQGKRGRGGTKRKSGKKEKERLKQYEKKSIEHAKKRLEAKLQQNQPQLFESTNKNGKQKGTAEKARQRWQRARMAAISMTPLQDQRGTKTNAMLTKLSMILRGNIKESIYLNSPLPSPIEQKKPSPTVSGASEVSLSLEDIMGTSVSKVQNENMYSPSSKQTNYALELASAAKTRSVEVSLASMMAEAEALAKEVKLVTQGEQWTPNVESLTTPSNALSQTAGKPVGRNLMQEFGSRTGKSKGSISDGVSTSASKTDEPSSNGKPMIRHQRNKSAPIIFSESEQFASPTSSQDEEAEEIEVKDESEIESPRLSTFEDKATSNGTGEVSPRPGATPVSAQNQVEEDSPVTGLVLEPSEDSIHFVPEQPKTRDVNFTNNAAESSKKDEVLEQQKKKKKSRWLSKCLFFS